MPGLARLASRPIALRDRPAAGERPAPRPALRRLRLATGMLIVLVLALPAAGYLATPGVGDAPRLVAARLDRGGGRPLGLPLPARIAQATVAVEDRRFFQHGALDPRALARIAWWKLTDHETDPGGATLSVQLAKLLYGAGGGIGGALRDVALAVKLEQGYSRPRILEMYLDAAYYGEGAYGVEAASRRYFGLPPARLSWARAALLAGLLQAPSALDPLRHPAAALARRTVVLEALARSGRLSAVQAARISRQPLGLRPGLPSR